jgi:cystathionine beta-lyase
VIVNDELREKVRAKLYEFGHDCGRPPLFSLIAQTAAYTCGEKYLDEMLVYLNKNIDLAEEYLSGLPVKFRRPEASFLLWVDCRKLNLNTAGLAELLAKAGISADPGHYYDTYKIDGYTGLQHHFRLAVGMSRKLLEPALENLRSVLLKCN